MVIDTAKIRRLMDDRELTQTRLAELSGLSRARIGSILKQDTAHVQAGTERRLARALGLPAGALDKHGVKVAYLARLREEHGSLDSTGLGVFNRAEAVPMARGFVPLTLKARSRETGDCRAAEGECGCAKPAVRREEPSLSLAQAMEHFQRFFLLGDPGEGKTTALRHVAWAYAADGEAENPYPSESRVPVYVRLADWAAQIESDAEVDVINAALASVSDVDREATANWLNGELDAGNVLLLLDGLDEVVEPELRDALVERIRGLCRHKKARFIVTSRVVGFDPFDLGTDSGVVVIEPLSVGSIRRFAEAWCSFRHGHVTGRACTACEKRVEQLRHAVIDHPRVRALARNPMMLTILFLLQETGAILPQRRWDLYERVAQALLVCWGEKKRIAMPAAPDRALWLEEREIVWFLESLALEMQRQDWTIIPRWWFAEHGRLFLENELHLAATEARAATDALLWSLHARAGLLVERGPERYAFRHLAFQEYFAARAVLASDDPVKTLEPYYYHPRWQEVVRLIASELDRRRAPRLLRAILDDPDPTGRFLRRGLLTVLGCLADGAVLHDGRLMADLHEQVAGLGSTRWLGLGLDALPLLSELKETRLDAFAQSAARALLDRAKASLPPTDWFVMRLRAQACNLVEESGAANETPADAIDASRPVKEIAVGGEAYVLLVSGCSRQADSAARRKGLLDQLTHDRSERVRSACARELGRYVTTSSTTRRRLIELLDREKVPSVRESIARSLGRGARNAAARERLLKGVRRDPDPRIQGACAAALASVAAGDPAVRALLLETFGAGDAVVRAGAARGLARCASADAGVRKLLRDAMIDEAAHPEVRVACVWALEDRAASDSELRAAIIGLLDSSNAWLRGVAAQVVATHAAAGQLDWATLPIEEAQKELTLLERPCSCALDALRGLAEARESRRQGIPLAGRLRRALAGVADRIELMFVFGSTARGEQHAASDIDLMVIGDVSLKELAPYLRRAEHELGRQVNAVVYAQSEWSKRFREGDPFVAQVLKEEKVFVAGGPDELAAVGG